MASYRVYHLSTWHASTIWSTYRYLSTCTGVRNRLFVFQLCPLSVKVLCGCNETEAHSRGGHLHQIYISACFESRLLSTTTSPRCWPVPSYHCRFASTGNLYCALRGLTWKTTACKRQGKLSLLSNVFSYYNVILIYRVGQIPRIRTTSSRRRMHT